jgi:hypothetical protein
MFFALDSSLLAVRLFPIATVSSGGTTWLVSPFLFLLIPPLAEVPHTHNRAWRLSYHIHSLIRISLPLSDYAIKTHGELKL